MRIHREIFREYDVRGVVGQHLTPHVARGVARAFGSEFEERHAPTVAVGRDNRPSSPELAAAICRGLNEAGVRALDVGTLPTPVLYFAALSLETDGGMQVTGSHNPPEYNGIKMVRDNRPVYGAAIQALAARIEEERYAGGEAETERVTVLDRYVESFAARARVVEPLRLVLDCGNGAGSVVSGRALRAAGIEVDPLFCESDGTFPNHHPDPTVDENLQDLIARVKETRAAFGVGLDGDADRIGVVTDEGEVLRGDRLLLLFAVELLRDLPGAEVIFDVKCSQALPEAVAARGGVPVMWKTGHSLIKERMRESGAPIAGEMSGHICFADRYFGFDDATYAAARLAEIVARSGRPLSALAGEIPAYPSTPELRVACPEDRKFRVVERAVAHYRASHEVIDIDGARVQFAGGWALIRASNTQPVLVVRVEAESESRLREIRAEVAAFLAREGVHLDAVGEP
ncbi:MAG: phosphomannomutase/phosphoglucomutase [Gemmatimonadota bacterium]